MSFSKENTILTQFSLSSDSINFEDSALISGLIEDLTNSRISMQKENSDLHSEIELINEDRHRLRLENDQLKEKLNKSYLKTIQIELLSKIATKSLEKLYSQETPPKPDLSQSTPKNSNKMPEKGLKKNGKVSPILKRYLLSRTASSTSPLIICRSTSKLTTYRTIINK